MSAILATALMAISLGAYSHAASESTILHESEQEANVHRKLELESDLDLVGHPVSYGALASSLSSKWFSGWNIPTILDEAALSRHALRLDNIAVPHPLRAAGVRRRTSLRFILNARGIGYYVTDNRLVVTTDRIARMKWLTLLPKPQPRSLVSESVVARREAAFAAGFWQVDPDVWMDPLVRALIDRDREVRFDAAYALGEMGPQAEKAIDPLISLLRENDLTLREAAVYALGACLGNRANGTGFNVRSRGG